MLTKYNQTCLVTTSSQQQNEFKCKCDQFYWGSKCQYYSNPCLNNRCNSNSVCQPLDNLFYECKCNQTSNPCLNNSTCTYSMYTNSLECNCSSMYYGDRCENCK